MIKLKRIKKPAELTEALQKELTEKFKKDKKVAVWNKIFIRENLLKESNSKCVYCECFIGPGEKEMNVDHFHCKDKYKEEVVSWENLIPSCPHCNKSKSNHDTYEVPIINPFEQNPKDYFYLKNYRYRIKNNTIKKIASDTIEVLGLNDTENKVKKRFEQGEELSNKLELIHQLVIENKENLLESTSKKNRIIKGCHNLLKLGTKKAEYSAFMATIIQSDEKYHEIRQILIELNLWDEELKELDKETKEVAMVEEKNFS